MNLRHSARIWIAVLATLVLPLTARAQNGINLSWNDCGLHGSDLKTFACNTNSGSDRLYISVMTDIPLPQLNGVYLEAYVLVQGPTVSPWWHMETGGCRGGAITGFYDFTSGPSSCFDVWQGQAAGGVDWQSGYLAPNQGRLRGVAAIAGTTEAPMNTEMYVFGFNLSHAKTTGTGSCAGCSDAACIALQQVQLTQPAGVGDYTFTQPLDRNVVGWKCQSVVYTEFGPACANQCPVPALKSSWGTIKSLYR